MRRIAFVYVAIMDDILGGSGAELNLCDHGFNVLQQLAFGPLAAAAPFCTTNRRSLLQTRCERGSLLGRSTRQGVEPSRRAADAKHDGVSDLEVR